jgi:hypothetical protein
MTRHDARIDGAPSGSTLLALGCGRVGTGALLRELVSQYSKHSDWSHERRTRRVAGRRAAPRKKGKAQPAQGILRSTRDHRFQRCRPQRVAPPRPTWPRARTSRGHPNRRARTVRRRHRHQAVAHVQPSRHQRSQRHASDLHRRPARSSRRPAVSKAGQSAARSRDHTVAGRFLEISGGEGIRTPGGVTRHGGFQNRARAERLHVYDGMGTLRELAVQLLRRMQDGTCTSGDVARLAADVLANPPPVMAAAQRHLRESGRPA